MSVLTEKLKATGKVHMKLIGPDGKIKDERKFTNVVVQGGLAYIAARMVETGRPTEMSYMGLGSSGTAALVTDTTLGTQLSREALDTSTVSTDTVTYVATFPAGSATGAIQEAGIFNASTGGTMLCRTTFLEVNKGADDSLTVSWEVTIS